MGQYSDVIPVTITADTVALDADGISVAASVSNNAALVIGGALADSGSVTLSHGDRKSTRLNSSHGYISYAVFCLKKKKNKKEKRKKKKK